MFIKKLFIIIIALISVNLFGVENDIVNILKLQIGQQVPSNAERINKTEYVIQSGYKNDIISYNKFFAGNGIIKRIDLEYQSISWTSLMELQYEFLNILDKLGQPYKKGILSISWITDGYFIEFDYIGRANSIYEINPIYKINLSVDQIKSGLELVSLTEEECNEFMIPFGIVIADVIPSTPADIAGFMFGDIIIALNGIELRSDEEYIRIMDELSVNDVIIVTILRNNIRIDIHLKL